LGSGLLAENYWHYPSNEVIVGLNKAEWYQLLKYVWDKKFNFLFLDSTKPFNRMYHKNFNNLKLTTEMDTQMDW
jgi:hypothetical protein